jgi:non-specific serine/threonine protein kinase
MAGMQHDHKPATRYFQESLELWQTVGDASRQAGAHLNLGLVAHITGQVDEAQRQLERAYELFLSVGDRSGQAKAVGSRARLARQQNDLDRAMRLVEESLDLFQAVGDRFGTAQALANLGQVKLALDDRAGAGVAFRRALEAWRALGNIVDVAECLEGVAAVVVDTQPRRAAHLLGAAEALRERSGALVAAVDLSRYAKLVAQLKAHLREDTFAGAWTEGRGLPIDEAMDLALREDASKRAGSSVAVQTDEGDALTPRDTLSPREREIARLIAQGQSNRAIADGLVVAVKTVETHIQHIFRKLHVKNRAEIGVWAARTGLV